MAGGPPTRGAMVEEAQAVRACAGCAITTPGDDHGHRETHDGRCAYPPPRTRHAICRRAAPAHPGLPDRRGAPAGVARLPGRPHALDQPRGTADTPGAAVHLV